ncbi:unnamed protein product, partial [Aphanomyces euteiches]
VVCRGCNRLWHVTINGQNRKVRACVTCSLSAGTAVTPAKKTSRSSRPALTPHNWTDILSQISEWTEDKVAVIAEADDVKSIDLSNYGDSGRERSTEDVVVLEIPSMRRLPDKEHPMS